MTAVAAVGLNRVTTLTYATRPILVMKTHIAVTMSAVMTAHV